MLMTSPVSCISDSACLAWETGRKLLYLMHHITLFQHLTTQHDGCGYATSTALTFVVIKPSNAFMDVRSYPNHVQGGTCRPVA